jgi:predicted glycoside hydrolase/deacetylase ChbG (UPF0249 family)
MVKKYFILNANNFGLSQEYNQAILEGYNNGFLTSATICANGEAFDNAVHDILPDCPNLGIGIQLNLSKGKILTDCYLLRDYENCFCKNFLYFLFNRKNTNVLDQIEKEYRAQIEKVKEYANISHIASFDDIHAIPEIFNIVCKLAKEYDIKFVQTHFEDLYFIPKMEKHLKANYPLNLLKVILLQNFTRQNRILIDKYELKTNDFMLGLNYYGMMSSDTIEQGLKILDEDCTVETVIHPKKYNNSTKDWHTREFGLTQNLTLKDTISRLGFDITNYKNIK